MILEDDCYREVPKENVLPGDILLYISTEYSDIEHSAIVIEAPSEDTLQIPKVVSKWGKGPEVIHYANNCPYDFSVARYFRVDD